MGLIEQIAEMRVQEVEKSKDRKTVEILLLNTDFSAEKIASLANVSVFFVEKIKESLCAK